MEEGTRQREGFNEYWHLGAQRSIERLRDVMKERGRAPSVRTLYSWSSQFHWQERLLDLEREAREQDRLAQIEGVKDMNERHRKEGLALQQKGLEKFVATPAITMSPSDAIRALIEGVKLERLAVGEPTERIRQEGEFLHGHIDLGKFTNEELRRLAQLTDGHLWGVREEESP